jgi:molecular chaperone DnaK (HSP70)
MSTNPTWRLIVATFARCAVQIQANSGLSQRDIDRMLKEAELQKERDQQIKELAEVKNEAETLIRSAEVTFLSLSLLLP